MKVRTLVAVAVAGFLATSLAYAAPEAKALMADDTTMDSGSTAPQGPSSTDNIGSDNQPTQNGPDQAPTPSDNGTSNSNDDSSADTATGDDDY